MKASTLFDFRHKKNWSEALVLYVILFFTVAVIGGLLASVSSLFVPGLDTMEAGLAFGVKIGATVAAFASFAVASWVLHCKGRLGRLDSIGLILLSGILGIIGGALLGMIIPAVLLTKERGVMPLEISSRSLLKGAGGMFAGIAWLLILIFVVLGIVGLLKFGILQL